MIPEDVNNILVEFIWRPDKWIGQEEWREKIETLLTVAEKLELDSSRSDVNVTFETNGLEEGPELVGRCPRCDGYASETGVGHEIVCEDPDCAYTSRLPPEDRVLRPAYTTVATDTTPSIADADERECSGTANGPDCDWDRTCPVHGGNSDVSNTPQPAPTEMDSERRERYAENLLADLCTCGLPEHCVCEITLKEAVHAGFADAAMAIADEEIRYHQRQAEKWADLWAGSQEDNARLRAELEENNGVLKVLRRQRNEAEKAYAKLLGERDYLRQDLGGWQFTAADRKQRADEAEATVERVHALADHLESEGLRLAHDIRTALNGETE